MRTEVVEDIVGLRALTAEWDGLVQHALGDTLFVDPAFLVPWWEVYGLDGGVATGARLHTVGVRADDGGLAGLAPLYAVDATLRWLGSGGDTSPDYLGLVVRPGAEAAVAEALAAHLTGSAAPPWDALLLTDMADDTLMTHTLAAALGRTTNVLVGRSAGDVCAQLRLAGDVAAHRAGLRGRLRRIVTYDRPRVERKGARFCRWTDEGSPAAGIAELARLHGLRFESRGMPHSFASSHYCTFHARVAEAFHRRGELRLYALMAGRQAVAMLYGFRRGPVLYYFQSGFDPAWASASVGHVLLSYAIEDAISEGARRLDFLKGDHAYKDVWATSWRRTRQLTAVRLSRRGLTHLYRSVGRPWASELRHRLRARGRRLGQVMQWITGRLAVQRDRVRMMARRGVRAAVGRRGVVRGVGERLRLVDPAPFLVAPAHHDAGAPRSA